MEEETAFNPKRRLCPDGACTGIIGPDGRCVECGRAAGSQPGIDDGSGSQSVFALLDASDEAAAAREAAPAAGPPRDVPETGASAFDPNRRLCDDGACVGVIGFDGTCTVCGRPAKPT